LLGSNKPFAFYAIKDRLSANTCCRDEVMQTSSPTQETIMIRISKLALIAALAAVTVASPALAQSFNPRDGTGNSMPLQYQADGGRSAWTGTQPEVQVAQRKGGSMQVARRSGSVQVAARRSGSVQIAAHHNKAIKVAGHRTAQHGV
jgi:hypothetical protein